MSLKGKVLILFVANIFTACDPVYHVYFENKSEKNLTIIVDQEHSNYPFKLRAYPAMEMVKDTSTFTQKFYKRGKQQYNINLQPNEMIILEGAVGSRPLEYSNKTYSVIIGQDTIVLAEKEIFGRLKEREKRNYFFEFKGKQK